MGWILAETFKDGASVSIRDWDAGEFASPSCSSAKATNMPGAASSYRPRPLPMTRALARPHCSRRSTLPWDHLQRFRDILPSLGHAVSSRRGCRTPASHDHRLRTYVRDDRRHTRPAVVYAFSRDCGSTDPERHLVPPSRDSAGRRWFADLEHWMRARHALAPRRGRGAQSCGSATVIPS
jgi:hypothetical protein